MSIINNESIINGNKVIDLGNLDLEIECNTYLKKDVFFSNYSNDSKTKLLNIVFSYNEKDNEISEYKFKIKNENKKFFRASALIVGGGGGGGYNIGGGGGGGRVIYYDSFLFSTNTNYSIFVGKAGKGGTEEYEAGESGYNSGLSSILAIGGGGGSSHVFTRPLDIVNNEKNNIEYGGQKAKGLNGGSGGGSCGLQYKEEKDGNTKGMSKELEKTYEYHSYGFNGGNSYDINNKLENSENLVLRGGGGGGASENGENNYSIIGNQFGKGGDGIAIQDINAGNGDEKKYCPILITDKFNIECINEEFDKINKRRTKKNNPNKIYWGAGGGGGSFNIRAGDGGKGGGGGGGYYENILKLPDKNLIGRGGEGILNVNNNGLSSSEELNQENMHKLTKGGDGINYTGSGGGGGGVGGYGGNGANGVVILLIETEEEEEEKEERIYQNNDEEIKEIITKFEKNKELLGINIAKFYHYNIKDNKEFYSYIDKLYENVIIKSDFAIPFNYDRKVYDSKFHEYIKIISELKIEYDPILFYLKKDNTNKYVDNNNLFNYQRLLIIIIDIIEDLMVFKREHKDYYKLLKTIEDIEIKYIEKERINEFDLDINIDNVKIKEENFKLELLIHNKNLQLNEIIKLEIPNYYKLTKIQKENTLNNINNKNIKNLQKDIIELKKLQDENNFKIENYAKEDIYYTYNKKDNKLILYISDNNNYIVRNFSTNDFEKIITKGLFGADQDIKEDKFIIDNIQELYNINSIDEYIDKNDLNDANKLNEFIRIYLYTFLNVKEYNFNRNLISLYQYYSQILILQTFYKESEKILISRNILYNSKDEVETEKEIFNICGGNDKSENQLKKYKNGLYDLLTNIDRTVLNIKSLNGYGFINRYINYFKINYGVIISNSCPYITIKFSTYDSERIKKYFRESINDKEILDYRKEEKYYNNLIDSFVIEIDNKRFNIIEFNFIDENIISIKIEDRLYKICKNEYIKKLNNSCILNEVDMENQNIYDKNKNKICNILILPKDSTFIKDIYQTDVEKIEDYNTKINKYKKELDNIDLNYNKFKNKYDKIITKNYIFYFTLSIITLSLLFIYFFNITTNTKSMILLIILSVIIILIIINYLTRVHYEDVVESFSNSEEIDSINNFTYYKINKSNVISNKKINQHWEIKILLRDIDSNNLKFPSKKINNIDLLKNKLINNLILWRSNSYYNEILKITNIEISTKDENFNKITHITFLSNKNITVNTLINDITILKKEDNIFRSLINNHDEYMTWKDISKCSMYFQHQNDKIKQKQIEKYKLLHLYTIRNDLLRYINNRYLEINKIIDSIELEKANNLYNNVDKVLKNEKNSHDNYEKEYVYKKKYNKNINNIYKHRILLQSNFVNMGLVFYMTVIIILLLLNIFPDNIIIILIIGFVILLLNILIYSTKILHPTRKNANQKYWSKPDKLLELFKK
tara:strand:+ start:1694 stop:6028 length:4335 start_codon:yes stop_codon:yes gene_type:complete